MQRAGMVKAVCASLFFMLMNYRGVSQGLQIDSKDIEPLIREWNYANNSRSRESFSNVYGDQLIFYTQTLSESKAIALKQRMFKVRPGFRQRINSDLKYVPYTSGLIKVDFTKEVFERSGWKEYPSYLLVSYKGNRYQIVGESDYATDKTLKYQLRIGQPMEFAAFPAQHVSVTKDSSRAALYTSAERMIIAMEEFLDTGDWSAIISPLSSMGTVTIPKGYIFVLIAILVMGGMMIFIADSVRSGKRRKGALMQREVFVQNGASLHNGGPLNNGAPAHNVTLRHNAMSMPKRHASDNVILAFKMQSVFEDFVVTLFDPLFFRHRRSKAKLVHAGSVSEREGAPDLEFEFNHKETHVKFAIKCLYYKNRGSRELQLFSVERQNALRDFEEDRKIDVYYVLGIGGTPDDPKELYLVPSKAIHGEFVRKEALRPYWKSGMFFYNRSARRLQ